MPKFDHLSHSHSWSLTHLQRVIAVVAVFVMTSLSAGQAVGETGADGADNSGDSATSQATSTTAWIIRDRAAADATRDSFRKGLKDALRTHSGEHLVGQSDLADRVSKRPATVPACLFGVERCGSVLNVALDQLDIDTVVRVTLRASGDKTKTGASYTLVDRTGEPRREAELTSENPRDLAFALVRDIFDATGTIQVSSSPKGAAVLINGETIGNTPVDQRLPIGKHHYRIELTDYEPASGQVELTANSTKSIEVTLEPKSATLSVQGAPDGATISIDGETRGSVSQAIQLDPGSHRLVIRADGYRPMERDIEAKPGQSLQVTAPLEPESTWLKDIATDAIASNRYILRTSGSVSLHPTSFRGARTPIDNGSGELEFASFLEDGQLPAPPRTVRRTAVPFGLQLDLGYSGRNLGLIVASMSYSGASMNKKAELVRRTDSDRAGGRVQATVEGVRQFQLRPLQIRYRHFFKNFVPTLEAGTGVSLQWVLVRPDDTDEREVLHQAEAFWTVGAGAQYFFTPRIFVLGRYNIQDYFDAGQGVEHVFNIGAGMTFPDLFGFEPQPPETLD